MVQMQTGTTKNYSKQNRPTRRRTCSMCKSHSTVLGNRFSWFHQCAYFSRDLKPMDFAVWGYLAQQVTTKNNANLEDLKIYLKKAWADLDFNTFVPSLTRTEETLSCHRGERWTI
uniref:Uncharacterized protein n=1 Tax=Caenorhabditis japonica TaxID=281687 RepID=A0A8R1IZ44_CAEJA